MIVMPKQMIVMPKQWTNDCHA